MNAKRIVPTVIFSLFTAAYAVAGEEVTDTTSTFPELELDEIVVKAVRPFQKISKEGVIIDVQNTSMSKSGSLTDLLERLPSVNKTREGFEVIGKGTPVIYIDGREILDISEIGNLQSDQIANIEVISNPGPEYNAKALAIIKIQTAANKGSGLNADINLSYSGLRNADYSGLANISYITPKLGIYETAKYSRIGEMEKQQILQTAETDKYIAQNNRYNVNYTTQHIDNTLFVNYNITPSQIVGARYHVSFIPKCDYTMTMNSDIMNESGIFDRLTNNINLHRHNNLSHHINAFYTYQMLKWKTKVSFDYLVNAEGQSQTNAQSSDASDYELITADNQSKSQLYSIKVSLSGNIGAGKFSTGADFYLTRRYDFYHNTNPDIGSSHGILNENICSGFISYELPTHAGDFSAGMRYEHSGFQYIDSAKIRRTDNNFFPTLSWQRRFGMFHLQAALSSKIQRPKYNELSNNIIYVNSFCLSTGNPLLKNAIHRELSLTTRWKTLTVLTSLRRTSDAIVYWGETYDRDKSVTLMKMNNVNHLVKSITSVTWSPVFGRFSPVVSGSFIKQWLTVDNMSFNRPIYTFSITNALDCGKGWTAMLDLNYRSSGNTENAILHDNIFKLSASLRKSLLNDNLTLQLRVNDILNDCADNSTLYSPKHTLTQCTKWDSRNVTLSISYNLHGKISKSKTSESQFSNFNRL